MPQTREHLDICRLLAVHHGIVVLNKCDKAEGAWMDLQEEEIRALVRGTFLEGAPIVRVSAATGEGLPELDPPSTGSPPGSRGRTPRTCSVSPWTAPSR